MNDFGCISAYHSSGDYTFSFSIRKRNLDSWESRLALWKDYRRLEIIPHGRSRVPKIRPCSEFP